MKNEKIADAIANIVVGTIALVFIVFSLGVLFGFIL